MVWIRGKCTRTKSTSVGLYGRKNEESTKFLHKFCKLEVDIFKEITYSIR